MPVRCDNRYKIGAEGETILGPAMLSECMAIRVLSPAQERETRDSLVFLLIVKYFSISYKFSTISQIGLPCRGIWVSGCMSGRNFFKTFERGLSTTSSIGIIL